MARPLHLDLLFLSATAALALGCSRRPSSAQGDLGDKGELTGPGAIAVTNASAAPSGAKVFAKAPRAACSARAADFRFPPVTAREFNVGECRTHDECTKKAPGYCSAHQRQPPHGFSPPSTCVYDACMSDAQCAAGSLCQCGDQAPNACVPGNCTRSEDCGTNVECRPSYGPDFRTGATGLYCETPKDKCGRGNPCSRSERCAFSGSRWECVFTPPLQPG
ncbi:MAG: hypothetical protein JNL38_39665 [Myxococcales bacterium]|jgi:hypothetical protein|nr:hypothetical protein [Myxococcales bacterium]